MFKCCRKAQKTAREEERKKDLGNCPQTMDVTKYATLAKSANSANFQHLEEEGKKKRVCTLLNLRHILKNMRLDGLGLFHPKLRI